MSDLPPSPDPEIEEEMGWEAPLPRLPSSRPRQPTPTLTPGSPEGPPPAAETAPRATDEPGADAAAGSPSTARSSPASTEPAPPSRPARPAAAPEDVRAAIEETCQMAFVLAAGFANRTRARAVPEEHRALAMAWWAPTEEEITKVTKPASRIAGRHIDTVAFGPDTIDACLLTAGLGAYAKRAVFDPIPAEEPTHGA